jgi:hypothetical protein
MPQQQYSTTGKVHAILDPEERGQYTARKVALEIEGYKRAETPVFEFFGRNAEKVNGLREGQQVTIHWELKGNENKGRFYVTLSGFKIETHGEYDGQGPADRNMSRPPEKRASNSPADYGRSRHPVTKDADLGSEDEIPF